MTKNRHGKPLVVAIAGALLLAACGHEAPPPAPVAPAPAPTAAAPAPAPAPVAPAPTTSLTSVTLSNAAGGTASATFGAKDTIYAIVATNSTGATSNTLAAKWTFGEGTLVKNEEQKIAANGAASTTFQISKPSGWPAGKYTVEISLDGKVVNTSGFEVK
ncbi:MAG TPA: hypothetical protein VIC31_11315 [Rudaea sp.]|jgi:hypothetical protein